MEASSKGGSDSHVKVNVKKDVIVKEAVMEEATMEEPAKEEATKEEGPMEEVIVKEATMEEPTSSSSWRDGEVEMGGPPPRKAKGPGGGAIKPFKAPPPQYTPPPHYDIVWF